MAAEGYNEGFTVLDEMVCDAIPMTSDPLGTPGQGRNDGFFVVEECVHDAGGGADNPAGLSLGGEMFVLDEMGCDAIPLTPHANGHTPRPLDPALAAEVRRLAAAVAATADPVHTAALVRGLLAAEFERRPGHGG